MFGRWRRRSRTEVGYSREEEGGREREGGFYCCGRSSGLPAVGVALGTKWEGEEGRDGEREKQGAYLDHNALDNLLPS